MCRVPSVTLFLATLLLPPSASSAGSTYSGTVVADGKPIDGAKVWLRSYSRTSEAEVALVETRTDSQGRFTLTGPKEADAHPYELIARAADGRIGWFTLQRDDSAESDHLRIELHPVGEAQGRLTDSAGRPIPDIRLRLRSFGIREGKASSESRYREIPEPLSSVFETTIRSDGTFVLRGIPLGARVHALVTAPGHGNPDIFWMQGQDGDFRLERAGRVRIRFTGVADPRKLAGLPLDLFTLPASGAKEGQPLTSASKSVKAKDQATLDIEDMLPGRCELRFWARRRCRICPQNCPSSPSSLASERKLPSRWSRRRMCAAESSIGRQRRASPA